MLIDFTLGNFRSFKDSATLSMETGGGVQQWAHENTVPIKPELSLLKSAAIFGANGAGKSTVLAGLERMRQMVVGPTEQITDNLPYEPFRFDRDSASKRTTFMVNFTRDDQQYRYAFSYTATQIVNEVLSVAAGDDYEVLFAREKGTMTVVPEGLLSVTQRVRPNALMLYALQDWNYRPAITVFEWFNDDLIILNEHPSGHALDNEWLHSQMAQFLRAVGSEVAGITQRKVAVQFLDGSAFTRPDLYLVYEKYDEEGAVIGREELPLTSASMGMQQLVVLGLALITAQHAEHPQTILTDNRLDAIHPTALAALLALFNSVANTSQVILTTNQPALMSQHLRVDQIYLAEKDYRGESQLVSLFDFVDVPAEGWLQDYLSGRFGAMPTVNPSDLLAAFDPNL